MSSPSNILVVGYYNHHNLGDEQYKTTIHFLLKRVFYKNMVLPEVTFIDCDRLPEYDIKPHTAIILGGGDVLNDYFLDKLHVKFPQKSPAERKIIALSVGIPYNDVFLNPEKRQKLELLDHIFLRTKQDMDILSKYIDKNRVHYLPDTSCLALDAIKPQDYKQCMTQSFRTVYDELLQRVKCGRLIGIMFCRHIYHPKYQENYQRIVEQFAVMIEALVNDGYQVVLLPFNTKTSESENDILIQNDVYHCLPKHYETSVTNIQITLSLEQTMMVYRLLFMAIPMRFHATLFSVYTGVPMIPIYTTKKIRNFLLDIEWTHEYPMEKNDKDLPISFDAEEMYSKIRTLIDDATYVESKKILRRAYEEFKHKSIDRTVTIRNTLQNQYKPISKLAIPMLFRKKLPREQPLYESLVDKSLRELGANQPPPEDDKYKIYDCTDQDILALFRRLQQFAQEYEMDDFRKITDPQLKYVAACVVSYYLTGIIDSPYSHGLIEKMFQPKYNYVEEWKWVRADYQRRNENIQDIIPVELPSVVSTLTAREQEAYDTYRNSPSNMRFNMTYINQNDESGVHRSGWKYVYDNLLKVNDRHAPILLDLYVDCTFHWKRMVYKHIDIIPYRKPWVGFIHHTFDTTFSEYNNYNLVKSKEFLESLDTCRGLIVLSTVLQTQFIHFFENSDIMPKSPIPIYVLKHPTEIHVPTFQYQQFVQNTDKKLLHIGGWLRNIFSFYQLRLKGAYNFVDSVDTSHHSKKQVSFLQNVLTSHVPDQLPTPNDNQPPSESLLKRCTKCLSRRNREEKTSLKLVSLLENMHEKNTLSNPPTTLFQSFVEKGAKSKTHTMNVTQDKLRKVILKGKHMDNYFPNQSYLDRCFEGMDTKTVQRNTSYCSSGTSSEKIKNNWVKHMMKYIQDIQTDVQIQEFLNNTEYDELLTRNIVFIHLVDGSAINTLLECFVRNTPILVNRHPAVVEVLGESYPLYYDDPETVHELLASPTAIYDAHVYLTQQDKTPYSMDAFMTQLNKIYGIVSKI